MSRESIVFCFGLLILLVPFLGLPSLWKEWFLVFAGVMLMVIGFTLRRRSFLRSIEHVDGERKADAFSETATTYREAEKEEPLEELIVERV